jgi:hypothetical protein
MDAPEAAYDAHAPEDAAELVPLAASPDNAAPWWEVYCGDARAVHKDLDVWEGRDEYLRHFGDTGRIATIDGDHAARDVVLRHPRGIAAPPRLGVRACELVDFLAVVRHRLGTTLTLAPR